VVKDANGIVLQRSLPGRPSEVVVRSFQAHVSRGRKIAGAISRKPFHVALEDSYIRANYGETNELCKLNCIPFNATGEKIPSEGLWCVYEFGQQLDAMMFWHCFRGRWLRGEEFIFPRAAGQHAGDDRAEAPRQFRDQAAQPQSPKKREFFKYLPETIGYFAPRMAKIGA